MRTMIDGKPLCYDVFCCAGGATKGYQRAGFYVVGVDKNKQPHYCGDGFLQMDALQFLRQVALGLFPKPYLIHTSPPCQKFCIMTRGRWQNRNNHPDLISQVRELLILTGVPYVIENVRGAPLQASLMLCGTMFDLRASNEAQLWRHRYFETNPVLCFSPTTCKHEKQPAIGVYGGGQHPLRKNRIRKNATIGVYGSTDRQSNRDDKSFYGISDRKLAMGIDWMTSKELNESIPPAYTEFIGKHISEMIL